MRPSRALCTLFSPLVALLALGCSSAPTTPPGSETGSGGSSASFLPPPPPRWDASASGWATVADLGLNGTTGGEGGKVVEVSTTADFKYWVELDGPRVILLSGVVGEGTRVKIASNNTVIGQPGAEFHGGLRLDGSSNVIVRNLKIVGNNCTDNPTDCSGGADAFTIGDGSHHVWIDHCDVSDGSDGNLDINDQSDYITISWTKFWYSGPRAGGHQFSNLIGSSDNSTGDAGHLRVTWHHDYWAENVDERMPRVRFGAVHIYNSLYAASGNSYCVGVGYYANILTEANVFVGVNDPIESQSHSNAESVVVSRDNLYLGTSGEIADKGTNVFAPPYAYTLDKPNLIQSDVSANAGTCTKNFSATPVLTCTE